MGPDRKEDVHNAKNYLTFGYGAHYCVGERGRRRGARRSACVLLPVAEPTGLGAAGGNAPRSVGQLGECSAGLRWRACCFGHRCLSHAPRTALCPRPPPRRQGVRHQPAGHVPVHRVAGVRVGPAAHARLGCVGLVGAAAGRRAGAAGCLPTSRDTTSCCNLSSLLVASLTTTTHSALHASPPTPHPPNRAPCTPTATPRCRPHEVPAHHLPTRFSHLAAATRRPVRRPPAAAPAALPPQWRGAGLRAWRLMPGASASASDPDHAAALWARARTAQLRRTNQLALLSLIPLPFCSRRIALPSPDIGRYLNLFAAPLATCAAHAGPALGPTPGLWVGPRAGGPPAALPPLLPEYVCCPCRPLVGVAVCYCALHCHSSLIADTMPSHRSGCPPLAANSAGRP